MLTFDGLLGLNTSGTKCLRSNQGIVAAATGLTKMVRPFLITLVTIACYHGTGKIMTRIQHTSLMKNDRPDKLREIAAQAELRGDWEHREILLDAADWIVRIEAQNQAFNKIFKSGIIVQINNYKRRFWNRTEQ